MNKSLEQARETGMEGWRSSSELHMIAYRDGFNACHTLMSTVPSEVEAEIETERENYGSCFAAYKNGARFGIGVGRNQANAELELLKTNYDIRCKEYDDFKNSLPETHWGYWRKRSGEMLDAWGERGYEIEALKAKLQNVESEICVLKKQLELAIKGLRRFQSFVHLEVCGGDHKAEDCDTEALDFIKHIEAIKNDIPELEGERKMVFFDGEKWVSQEVWEKLLEENNDSEEST